MMGGIDDLYNEKINLANGGNRAASLWLIKDFCATIKNNRQANGKPHVKPSGVHTQFHEGMLDYFHDCFNSIIDGVRAEKALGINKGESGADKIPKQQKLDRECKWCIEIFELINSGKCKLIKDAKRKVAQKSNVSESTIDKAWKNPTSKTAAKVVLRLREKDI